MPPVSFKVTYKLFKITSLKLILLKAVINACRHKGLRSQRHNSVVPTSRRRQIDVRIEHLGRAMQKYVFGHMQTAKAQIRLRFRCPLTESLDTIKFINGEQMPG